MRVLLTGHKGFIGSKLYANLQQDHEVMGLDIKSGDDLLSCDLPEKIDIVIHLAGKSGVRESIKNPEEYWNNNVEASKRLFSKYRRKRILYASSSSAYEPHLNPYASSKLMVERAAEDLPNALGMRFHTVYSNTPRENMFFYKLKNNKLEYVTNHYRDFIHIEDLISAIRLILTKKKQGVIDIGTGDPVRICEFRKDLPVNINTPNERQWTCANINYLKTLGFKPKYSIRKHLTNEEKSNILYLNNGDNK